MRIGVLASGAGTNLQAILDRVHGREGVEVVAVGSDQHDATALERAEKAGVATAVFARDEYPARAERDAAMGEWLAARAERDRYALVYGASAAPIAASVQDDRSWFETNGDDTLLDAPSAERPPARLPPAE